MAAQIGTVGTEFRIGRVLSRAIGICGRNIIPFTLIGLLTSLPNFGPSLLASSHYATEHAAIRILPFSFTSLVFIPIGFAIVLLVTLQDLDGAAPDFGAATRQAFARYLPLLGCTICGGLAVIGGMILLVVPGIIFLVLLSVCGQACVAERLGPIASLSRSAALTKGKRWRVLGLMLVILLISGGITAASRPLQLYLGTTGLIVAYLVTGVVEAFKNTISAVQFHDLRVAKEGIGTERIAAVFD